MSNPALLSTREAAKRLGMTPGTVNRLARQSKLEAIHQGPGIRGPRFFDPEVVAAFAASKKKRATPEGVTR